MKIVKNVKYRRGVFHFSGEMDELYFFSIGNVDIFANLCILCTIKLNNL